MDKLFVIGPITPVMVERLTPRFELVYEDQLEDPLAWLGTHGGSIAHVLTNGHDGVKAAYIDAMPALKIISNYGVGYDAIDAHACAERGIMVTHTPDVLNQEVATTALMLLLSCYREWISNEAHVRSGAWEAEGNAPLSRSADNRTIGIVGMGRIGQAIARKLQPFDPVLKYHTRSPKDVPYEYVADLVDMASQCDALIVITPGGPATHHLINEEVLNALGPDGVLVNVARGSVVDETAMIEALETGALGWAGLDVFDAEPHVPDRLRALPNTVLTPHVGSGTIETRAAMGNLTIDNLFCQLDGTAVLTPVPECAGLV